MPTSQQEVHGQAHFVRAICYIRLTSLWGAVPMISRVLAPADAKQPRTDVNELTTKLIIPDLEIRHYQPERKTLQWEMGKSHQTSCHGYESESIAL